MDETQHEKTATEEKGEKKKAGGKKKPKMFNDRNCDIDLFDSDPEKIIPKKIRINSSLIMSCRMLEMPAPNGGQIEWAAILLEKRKKDGTSYDFNCSLSTVPHLIEGLKKIIQANPKYFGKEAK